MKRATLTLIFLGISSRAISIHALVKRATKDGKFMIYWQSISIHALVKRATNSRAVYRTARQISIHALVKRATI